MQDVLMLSLLTLAIMGASCLFLLCKLIVLKIEREKREIKAIDDYASTVDRAPILDVIYGEEHYGAGS